MDRERAKQEILERSKEYFTPDNSGKGFICPICGSGTGTKGTGITTRDNIHFTCWTGCYTNADIFEIVGLEKGLTTFTQQIEYLAGCYHITLDDLHTPRSTAAEDFKQPVEKGAYQTETETETAPELPKDYTSFFFQANKDLTETDYYRGISPETLNRFKVGFVSDWRHPKAPAAVPASPRLIIPTSKSSYLARDTRPADQIPEQAKKYTKSKVGKTHLFNAKAFRKNNDDNAIFIVEGEIDAMSIEDVGGHAVGLGSMNNGNLLLQAVKEHKPTQTLVIALDNESDPRKANNVREKAVKIAADLKQEGVKAVIISDLWGQYKDANDMLQGDFFQFQERIDQVSSNPEEWEKVQYLNTFADHRTDDFVTWITGQEGTQYTPTGFKELDNILNGGLYNEKLYAIGAISSLGKTTLVNCLQLLNANAWIFCTSSGTVYAPEKVLGQKINSV